MTAASPPTIHASAALVDGIGVLVRGASGSGKSSLVLALIMADPARNRLIADDRVILTGIGGEIEAAPPEQLAGLIEMRGYGLVRLPYVAPQKIGFVVDLRPGDEIARMPAESERTARFGDVALPRLALPIGQGDGWIRVRAALMAGFTMVNET
ncbi:HPr kinase/phosphatase C-terminal domain-containing protein [Mesorhizobium sp. BR1-1-16]|uniref:HPr kinase/phosphorylase n=1 Tax=Mesorhizobium sp. BR1-1-16 TaxID=2876653 RepID=UPI001CCA026A|nr:HPr kinase/phosphatase C-terminal domain-containing protein [Mesorhizobium sp. BR1-1-16]MBZ9938125.1 HPr kinase/phosphatase C-terminal domain-containing protein [Mesorhizobium sp. BR1-1-16]